MRVEQPPGRRGSLKWIQRLVESSPHALHDGLRREGALAADDALTWMSPLREDAFAEYRDGAFLDRIGHSELADDLKRFWPQRGPQWDALAVDGRRSVYLFEAKAHTSEMASTCEAGDASRKKIKAACDNAKQLLGADQRADWLTGYYQYANRLAHLGFLRKHKVQAWLIFLYFTGDAEMAGPASPAEWDLAIRAAHQALGLSNHPQWVISLFQPIQDL